MTAITPAASVLLARGPESREIFAVRRSVQLKFFGGFWAFPGGRLDPGDAAPDGAGDPLAAQRLAACRELFEEAGILVARLPDGSFLPSSDDLERNRRAVLDSRLPFPQLLADRQLTLHADDFRHIGELVTPAFSLVRFATTFFAATAPPNQVPAVHDGELDMGRWATAEALVGEWTRGDILLTPPTALMLQGLAGRAVDAAPELLGPLFAGQGDGRLPDIPFAPGVAVVPLKALTLPPLEYTNAFLVGTGPRWLIDPGPDDLAEQRRLFDLLDGAPPDGIILSHHHPDHIGAAAACAERYRVPVWAHPVTAERLQGRVTVSRFLNEGDRIDLGQCPADGRPWHLDVLHTPGHDGGHLAFFEPFYRLLFAFDMVSTATSIVIVPPDGDLTVYLASLRRLRELPARLLLPSHGNASARPRQTIDEALEHRAKREAQLVEALRGGRAGVEELLPVLYRGVPEALWRLAAAQTQAGLHKLEREGRARECQGKWELA